MSYFQQRFKMNSFKLKIRYFFPLLVVTILSPIYLTAELRVATVDVGKILNESPQAQAAKQELGQKTASAKKEIVSKQAALAKLEEAIRSKGKNAQNGEVKDLRRKARELELYVSDTDEDLKAQFLARNRAITQNVLKLIEEYAVEKKIDLILNKGQVETGAVLFATKTADITNDILSRLTK
jgi:outer membrane protein